MVSERSGPRVNRHPPSWAANLTAGLLDLGQYAAVGGRASGQLMRLDGFRLDAVEFVVPRERRNVSTKWPVRTACVLDQVDCQVIAGFRTLSASRVIIDSAGRWTETHLGNAVDSAIRLGWTSETYLRRRLQSLRTSGKAGVRLLDRCLMASAARVGWSARHCGCCGPPASRRQRLRWFSGAIGERSPG